jgi:hypothetical protein
MAPPDRLPLPSKLSSSLANMRSSNSPLVLSAFSYSFSRVCKLDFNESSSRKFLKNVKPSALNNKVVVALDRKNS